MAAEEVRSFPSQKPFRSSPMTMNEYTGARLGRKEFYKPSINQSSLARHWARDWRALALAQVHCVVRKRKEAAQPHPHARRPLELRLAAFLRSVRTDEKESYRCLTDTGANSGNKSLLTISREFDAAFFAHGHQLRPYLVHPELLHARGGSMSIEQG